jgi:hypothetical protein
VSARDYAVLYLLPGGTKGATIIGGGNTVVSSGQHALDGPEHTGRDNLHTLWTLIEGGALSPTPGDPPTGELVVQVKTSAGAPTHTATRGTPCWVAPDLELYVNNDGAAGWTLVGAGGSAETVTYDNGGSGLAATDVQAAIDELAASGGTGAPMQYATELDDAGAGVTYVGEAVPGSATGDPAWRVKRITETGPDVSITWADGDADFDNVWDSRATLSYS